MSGTVGTAMETIGFSGAANFAARTGADGGTLSESDSDSSELAGSGGANPGISGKLITMSRATTTGPGGLGSASGSDSSSSGSGGSTSGTTGTLSATMEPVSYSGSGAGRAPTDDMIDGRDIGPDRDVEAATAGTTATGGSAATRLRGSRSLNGMASGSKLAGGLPNVASTSSSRIWMSSASGAGSSSGSC